MGLWVLRIDNETFSQSRPEEADISGEGEGDNVRHCMLLDFESYG